MSEDKTKRMTQKLGVKRFTERTTRDTTVHSSVFRVRWLQGLLVIESLVSKIDKHEVLNDAFHEAVEKEPEAIILHLPRPRYISSILIVSIRDIAREAERLGLPFVAVIHPKLRLLFQMFGLQSTIRTGENLDRSIEELHKEIRKHHLLKGIPVQDLDNHA